MPGTLSQKSGAGSDMKFSHALIGLGALYLIGRSGAFSPPSAYGGVAGPVSVDLAGIARKIQASFIPDSSSTLSPEGQLHNAVQRSRGVAVSMARDANILLSNQGALLARLRSGTGTAYLSASQVVELARSQFPNLTLTPRPGNNGIIRGYTVFLNG